MTARTVRRSPEARLTPQTVGSLFVAALAVFAVAYAVGGLFGRSADRGLSTADTRVVAAQEPSGDPLLTVVARSVAFDARELRIPADGPSRIRLDNVDAGIFHNIAIYRDGRAAELVARGALFDGPRVRDYVFEPIATGTYYFQCDLHPAMSGTLIAE